jgi:hypothetical protein
MPMPSRLKSVPRSKIRVRGTRKDGRILLSRQETRKVFEKSKRVSTKYHPIVKVRIGKSAVILRQRKDGRSEIPRGVVRKERLRKAKPFRISYLQFRRKETVRQRGFYTVERTRYSTFSRFYMAYFDDMSPSIIEDIKQHMIIDIAGIPKKSVDFYARMHFIIEKLKTGEIFEFAPSLPTITNGHLSLQDIGNIVNEFVNDCIDKVAIIQSRGSEGDVEILFERYSVTSEVIPVKQIRTELPEGF